MPVPVLNFVATQDNYVDALTVRFQTLRSGFALHVFNAAIMYKLLYRLPQGGPNDYLTELVEHRLAPSLSSFNDPIKEGLPPGSLFAGVMLRSAIAGTPGMVTVA